MKRLYKVLLSLVLSLLVLSCSPQPRHRASTDTTETYSAKTLTYYPSRNLTVKGTFNVDIIIILYKERWVEIINKENKNIVKLVVGRLVKYELFADEEEIYAYQSNLDKKPIALNFLYKNKVLTDIGIGEGTTLKIFTISAKIPPL